MNPQDNPNSIALVGLSGRFPGAASIANFWRNLRNGAESISFFTHDELRDEGVSENLLSDPAFVPAKAIACDPFLFDAGLFRFTPKEAEMTDPQQRIFLECAWEVLEDAGYDPKRYRGSIGLYAGSGRNTYIAGLLATEGALQSVPGLMIQIGNEKDHLAAMTAYKLDLRGPAVAVQTACSTSLVAVHLACQSLLTYQCDLALAGGVSFSFPRKSGYQYREGGIGSADGHCRAFDAKANGSVSGDGAALVALRRLSDAISGGDHIRAVILASAINNDGAAKAGYTAPSLSGQYEVIALAHELSGVNPESINYVEAHGTGTLLGDPIEVGALTKAFRLKTSKKSFCALGSLKTNAGHLDTAAGTAGLIKIALSLENGEIPPSLHYTQPNPHIDFETGPFYVPTAAAPWPSGGAPRRAAVSSFGIGGTNAHVIVEEAPPPSPRVTGPDDELLLVSANTPSALARSTEQLGAFLTAQNCELGDVAYTLQTGRVELPYRFAVGARTAVEAARDLSRYQEAGLHGHATATPSVVFLFPGQGAQYLGMCAGLYSRCRSFRRAVDECCLLLQPHVDFDLLSGLAGNGAGVPVAGNATAYVQPALFIAEYAMAQLWMELGVQPEALLGHSIGEYVAACLAGVFQLEDALRAVALRGALMQSLPPGRMAAVRISEDQAGAWAGGAVSLACINGPSACVFSGPPLEIAALLDRMHSAGIPSKLLETSHAFHSEMMRPITAQFRETVAKFKLEPPRKLVISNISGGVLTAAEATDPGYWASHILQPVLFAAGLRMLLANTGRVFLEAGPGRALSGFACQQGAPPARSIASMPVAADKERAWPCFLEAAGKLWVAGAAIDWQPLHEKKARRRTSLPTYPFERSRYSALRRPSRSDVAPPPKAEPARLPFDRWFWAPSWKRSFTRPNGDPPVRCNYLAIGALSGLAQETVRRLRAAGALVETLDLLPENGSAHGAESFGRNIEALRASSAMPIHVVDFSNFMPSSETGTESNAFQSILVIAKGLVRNTGTVPAWLTVVTSGAAAVDSGDVLRPDCASLTGFCRVLPLEHPRIRCRLLDTTGHLEGVDVLTRELLTPSSDSGVAAIRGEYLWMETFEPVSTDGAEALIRQGAVYWITGGTGGIGLTLALDLATRNQAKLVLTSRSAGKHSGVQTQIEQAGGEALVIDADAADEQAMNNAARLAHRRYGALNGLIHAAGTPAGSLIGNLTVDAMNSVFRPKVAALSVLERVLADERLDFAVFCSSLASFRGGVGQSAYCAANAYLDAWTRVNPWARANRAIAINWDAWGEVGMAFRAAVPDEIASWRESSLRLAIAPAEGAAAFRACLTAGLRQIAVSTAGPAEWRTGMQPLDARNSVKADAAVAATSETAAPYGQASDSVESRLAEIWSELIGIQQPGRFDNFFDTGGNSLLGIQLASRIHEVFHVDVPFRQIFESPTIAAMARFIVEQQSERIGPELMKALVANAQEIS